MSVAILLQLAAEFEARGAYAQAVKCLTPVCEATGQLPAVVGQASLRLARLLLTHFDNVPEAKAALLAAVRAGWGTPRMRRCPPTGAARPRPAGVAYAPGKRNPRPRPPRCRRRST